MAISADMFVKQAKEHGAADVRFVRADAFLYWQKEASERLLGVHQSLLCADPKALIKDAKSVAVLFFPAPPFFESDAPYPHYYIASQKAYLASRELVQFLIENGVNAVRAPSLPHRAAALRSGGVIGCNGLYYHDELGSYVHIELIINDTFEPMPDGGVSECAHCGRCVQACPTGAISISGQTMRHCIRNHLYTNDMPEAFRPFVTQLLGCERCQRACPRNASVAPVAIQKQQREALDPNTLLHGSLDAAKAMIGSNLARRKPMVSQTLLVIGAKELREYGVLLQGLEQALLSNVYYDWARSRTIDEQGGI